MGASADAEISTKTELLSEDEMTFVADDLKSDVMDDAPIINQTPHIVRYRHDSGNIEEY